VEKFREVTPIGPKVIVLKYAEFLANFYAPQLCRQALLRRVLAMGFLSVCLIITSTADELSSGINIDDLERP